MRQGYEELKRRISAAQQHYGKSAAIRLLAVSKTHPSQRVLQLHQETGHCEFAENYAQELLAKATELAAYPALRWVYIGQLQSNKIKTLVAAAAEIQSVASFKHAEAIAKHAAAIGKTPYPIYLALNAGEEASKGGVTFAELAALAAAITTDLPALSLEGLMAIPPRLADESSAPLVVPALYRKIKEASTLVGKGLLSLGMSDDLELAIGAGSTCLRVGSSLFGPRPQK